MEGSFGNKAHLWQKSAQNVWYVRQQAGGASVNLISPDSLPQNYPEPL